MMSSETLPLNVRIILSDPFSGCSSFYVACIYNLSDWTSQNRCSMMGLASHISCVYDTFSSYHISFSSMTSLTMMVMGTGNLVHALFRFPLTVLLVVSVAQNPLVVSVEYFQLVVSVGYFQLIELQNPLVVSVKYFPFVVSVEYFHLVEPVEYFQLVESQSYFQLVKSQNYFPAQKHS